MPNNSVYVTKPSLAPLNEFTYYLEQVWETGILTHNGPLVQKLESELEKKLNTSNLSLVTNGTVAIQMAIKALELKGEIITTPFSWVATVSAIKWEGCTPIFCDIDENTLNIDVSKIEDLITKDTVAIMPVHVFGNPCDVEAIDMIAKRHNLKVIYDAAHAVGTNYGEKSVLDYGDISTISLHGTKIFNTAEGGACIANSNELYERIKRIRFFGHDDHKIVVEDGCNGKLTEIHAALGLANLKYYDVVLECRRRMYELYVSKLQGLSSVRFQNIEAGCNFSYMPVVFESEALLLDVENALNSKSIFPRRYFYPSLNEMNNIVDYVSMPVSESVSRRILVLPLYYDINEDIVENVSKIIAETVGK
ncbi:DegT/DnrJ/EryC1/StrS family aminotransferase [Vibrio cholerae]|uniref:DegT/DnrJ/EryC1/StrS family aminotransferase n=1 Tax=Vibrio cholerae TaxID=666 RepID=UPI0011D47DD5|nr:DegT/DnrJ/EryC1/StrS family aminotransferase [Vibrio cholerae]TXY73109.1 DegT/DnrJ/EryC1/StrS family aminotransferase [Vibrio cholerae]BCN21964.1 dTDP-4-amino-4,6-dideoxy-D-glucose transaminase [Vibrio cholerae]GIB45599.1 UDP-4-amino-4-deoxy-L-arabinose--oxoglutarate aminotransferase [Vibrio cholerae]